MQLRRATVIGLHGLFTKTVKFFDDYTFLHGINGTGKTSLIRAIQAITQPDLDWLLTNEFERIEVWLANADRKIRIWCQKSDNTVTFGARIGNDVTTVDTDTAKLRYVVRDQVRRSDQIDRDNDVVESMIYELFSGNQIVQYIQNLPTPIVLGLSRTSLLETRRNKYNDLRSGGRIHFRAKGMPYESSLADGMAEAVELIQNESNEVAKQRAEEERQLRNDISLLMFSRQGGAPAAMELPTSQDIAKYRRMRSDIISALSAIGFDPARMQRDISAFFDEIIETARYLSGFKNIREFLDLAIGSVADAGQSSANRHFNFWFSKQQLLPLIDKYAQRVERYTNTVKESRSRIVSYEKIVNSFFEDSGKELSVEDVGIVSIVKDGKRIELSQLSSGEKQIFVLITHLSFNPRLRKANVLIIDEPEISLHVRWQEIFVESVLAANMQTQLILATHSPSIVLDRRDRMVDLNES